MTEEWMVDPALFTPTPEQVQALLVAREPFTGDSTPTYDQVAQRAADVAAELAGELTALPAQLFGLATSTIIYKVAADIEAGTWPEQQLGTGAAGGIWYARYVQSHDRLIAEARSLGDLPTSTYSVGAPSQTRAAADLIVANAGLLPWQFA